jgi:hypothetical protein
LGERARLATPVLDIIGGWQRHPPAIGLALADLRRRHDPIGLCVGRRLKQQRVDDAEDGGIGTDAERQSDDRNRGEAWTGGGEPRAVAQIVPESVHAFAPVEE